MRYRKIMLDDNWININEAAEYLGVKVATLRSWIKKGNGIPAHKVGKFWKFKRSELDEWVRSGKGAGE
jgi:excisionase family DNA binding protein